MKISIILPVMNEEARLLSTLASLQMLRQRGHELIVVDGGSQDRSREVVIPLVDKVLLCAPGRAKQMNFGAENATGDVYLFLHADTHAPEDLDRILLKHLPDAVRWGRFDIRLSGKQPIFRLLERLINLRSRISGIATGDQGIFISAGLFKKINGYPDIPLMEDIAICNKLKKISKPVCIKHTLITSSRRWEEKGILKTILLMWKIRLQYYFGANPDKLARQYD